MAGNNSDARSNNIGGEGSSDPETALRGPVEVEREAWQLSYEMVKLEVRKRFAQIDGDAHEVEQTGRKIDELKVHRRSLFMGKDEPEENSYQIAIWEEQCLEGVRDRILHQMGKRIAERREATAKGDSDRAQELTKEIIALRQRRQSVHFLFDGSAKKAKEGSK